MRGKASFLKEKFTRRKTDDNNYEVTVYLKDLGDNYKNSPHAYDTPSFKNTFIEDSNLNKRIEKLNTWFQEQSIEVLIEKESVDTYSILISNCKYKVDYFTDRVWKPEWVAQDLVNKAMQATNIQAHQLRLSKRSAL